MTEWASALAAFWLFWLLDGVRLPAHAVWNFTAARTSGRIRTRFARLQWPSWSPLGWRVVTEDIPLALSPLGLANRPVGGAGRPAATAPAAAWGLRWEEVRDFTVEKNWLHVNGQRFCPATGHVRAVELQQLAALTPEARTIEIENLFRRWLRPAHLRRHLQVLRIRTGPAAATNTMALVLAALVTLYLVAGGPASLPAPWVNAFSRLLPLFAGYAVLLHVMAIVSAARVRRKFPARSPGGPQSPLLAAALFPPQALRLRSVLTERAAAPQHPLAIATAAAGARELAEMAFAPLADLRWPLGQENDQPLAREIAAWHRARFAPLVEAMLVRRGVDLAAVLAPPAPDGAASCAYCPRCRAQFVTASGRCPHGIPLAPIR